MRVNRGLLETKTYTGCWSGVNILCRYDGCEFGGPEGTR